MKKFLFLILCIFNNFDMQAGIIDTLQNYFFKESSATKDIAILSASYYLLKFGVPYVTKLYKKGPADDKNSRSFKYEVTGKQLRELTYEGLDTLSMQGKNKDRKIQHSANVSLNNALDNLHYTLTTHDNIGMFDETVFKIKTAPGRSYPEGAVTRKGKIQLDAHFLASTPDIKVLGILYHEMGHIKNGDIIKGYLMQFALPLIMISSLYSTSSLLDKMMNDYYKTEPSPLYHTSKVLLLSSLGIIASRSITQRLCHYIEYTADQFAVQNPIAHKGLIASFKSSLKQASPPPPANVFQKIKSFLVDSDTHPRNELRLKKLELQLNSSKAIAYEGK